ncbi:MAG: hypothetical protein M3Z04_16560 [Chloroflexota bacterium]|nr:hypothetical protein [Chloroflexota bacterium]
MKKSEMNESQLQERDLFIATLEKAGWQGTPNNVLFDDGYRIEEEATMQYFKDAASMLAYYNATKAVIYLNLQFSGRELRLIIHYTNKLKAALETLVSFQDIISAKNYKQYVGELLDVCPHIDLMRGQEGQIITPILRDKGKINLS